MSNGLACSHITSKLGFRWHLGVLNHLKGVAPLVMDLHLFIWKLV